MEKPKFYISSMADIAALPWNGFKVASTFSGCGGSCLGYRMAGFHVVWANEFIPAAAATYRANHPETILDTRDIRTIQPTEILAATGLKVGELDLFDGSPPCSSFSTAGKGAKLWGRVKKYSDGAQRTDDLFLEYVRLLDGLKPKAFVAENVAGLVRGAAKGVFIDVVERLRAVGYRVTCRVLDAQWLGVPQGRRRTIFVGVRNDLGCDPVHPAPLPYRYTLGDILPVAAPVESETDFGGYAIAREWDKLRPGGQSEKYFQLVRPALNAPCPTVTATAGSTGAASVTHPTERRKFSIAELKAICGFPADFQLTGSYSQQVERLGRAVPPVMMSHVAAAVRDGVLSK